MPRTAKIKHKKSGKTIVKNKRVKEKKNEKF